MACRAISMIAFPLVQSMFIYRYMFVSLIRVCVIYLVKEVAFRGAQSINGRGIQKNACSSSTDQQKESCVAYVETGTNS